MAAATPKVRLDRILAQYILDHVAVDIGQSKVATGIVIRQPFVIDAQAVEHGRVQIVNGHTVFHRANTECIGLSIAHSPLDTSASHP